MTSSTAGPKGITVKSIMMSGRVGKDKFVDTDYSCSYREFKASDHHVILIKNFAKSQWASEAHPIGFALGGKWGVLDNSDVANPGGSSSTVAAVYNRAVIQNLKNRINVQLRLKAVDTRFDAAEALTGLKPSVKLVSESAIALLRAFIAVRKGNYQKAADVLGLRRKFSTRVFPEIWLELQYGWRPLANDIFDGVNEIIRAFNQRDVDFYTVTRQGGSSLLLPSVPNAGWQCTFSNSAGVTVEGKLRYTVNDSFVAYMNSLRITNPAYIAWTALPYSFVVDWIAPVGDMLTALNSATGLKSRGGYLSTRVYTHQSVSATGIAPFLGAPVVARFGSAKAECNALFFSRTGSVSFPPVMPYVTFPFGGPERIASAISLISTAKKYR
jgi:hypothetical protein